MTQPVPPEEKHPIADCLRELGITQAAIIDDAYDSPTVESFDGGEIGDFWAAIEREQEMLTELEQLLGRQVKKLEDIDNEVIRKLWRGLDKLGKLSDPCRKQLFPTKLQKRAEVDTLSNHLKTLGLDPIAVGAENDYLPAPTVKLIFLDYVLNPAERANLGELATQKAIQMYSRTKSDAEKPFIILISAVPNAEQQKEKFREDSRLLGGLFGFIAREDIRDREKLYLKLYSLGIGNPTHHAIQRFVDELVKSVNLTAKEFEKKIRTLDIQDYSFVQLFSLHEDGHPLGDYILWLFEAALAYMFCNCEGVQREQSKLDKLEFKEYLPWQTQPSTRLAEIYRYALTEPAVAELGPHPLDETGMMPLLRLGDIFIEKGTNSLLMVINAACDLMFAPTGSHKCDPEQPIYFVPGVLEPLNERKNGENVVRTELFEYDSRCYRIKWDYKHVHSQKYEAVWGYLKKEGYSRISRLRLPYALEVQQNFAANVTRIGMPVSPPIFDKADIEVYCYNDEDKKLNSVGEPILDGVVIIHAKGEDHFILTVDCISVLLDRIKAIVDRLEKQKEKVATEEEYFHEKVRKIDKVMEKLRQWTRSQSWLQMVTGHRSLPKADKMQELEAGTVGIYLNQNVEEDYKPKIPVVLNIKWRKGAEDKGET
jgi:hypothetical protein